MDQLSYALYTNTFNFLNIDAAHINFRKNTSGKSKFFRLLNTLNRHVDAPDFA